MAKKETTKATTSTARRGDYAILERPVITEKSSTVGQSGSVVTFRVARTAEKTEIKSAIERIYGVQVAQVRTVNYMGKPKRTMRSAGRRAAYKKAYVTLKPGQTISVVEGV